MFKVPAKLHLLLQGTAKLHLLLISPAKLHLLLQGPAKLHLLLQASQKIMTTSCPIHKKTQTRKRRNHFSSTDPPPKMHHMARLPPSFPFTPHKSTTTIKVSPHLDIMPLQHIVTYQAFCEITNFIPDNSDDWNEFCTTSTTYNTRNLRLPPLLSNHHRHTRLPKPKGSLLPNHFSEQTPTVLSSSPSNTTTSGGCTRRPKLLFGPPRRSISRLTLRIGIN